MANVTGQMQSGTYWLPSTANEDAIRSQWSQALGYLLPSLGLMTQAITPDLYSNYTNILGMQSQQALQDLQSEQQANMLLQQMNAAQQAGDMETAQALQAQILKLPSGQRMLANNQLYTTMMQMSQGQLPTLSPEAQQQISSIGQAYETQGMNAVDRAREQAMRTWGENTAQRGLRPSDTPSQAAWAPVEAELARQTANVGTGRGALEAQTRLQFAQQLPTSAAQLEAFRQALSTAAQTNRTTLGTASATPYQNMFSNIGNATNAYSPFTQQLQNARTGQQTSSTQWQPVGTASDTFKTIMQGVQGVGQAWPFIQQAGSAVGSGLSDLWNYATSLTW